MAHDYYYTLGAAPSEEACVQLGDTNYVARARAEIRAFRGQILRHCEANKHPLPNGVVLVNKAKLHEFGTYYELDVRYDPDNDTHCCFIDWLDNTAPSEWDEAAKQEQGIDAEG